MNARTSILTAAALLALAVPAAAGAASATADTAFRVTKETISLHEVGQSLTVHRNHALKGSKVSKKAAGTSSTEAVHPVTYIKVPGPAIAPSAVVDPNECQDSGNNCTDEQACQYWGMNCDAIATTASATPSQPVAPTTTTSLPPTATTGFNAGNCADYYDYINTGDSSYC